MADKYPKKPLLRSGGFVLMFDVIKLSAQKLKRDSRVYPVKFRQEYFTGVCHMKFFNKYFIGNKL